MKQILGSLQPCAEPAALELSGSEPEEYKMVDNSLYLFDLNRNYKMKSLYVLKMKSIYKNLCGLSLLLKLLELLRCDKTDRFVSCNQLRASRHGGENDVSAQAANTAHTGERNV